MSETTFPWSQRQWDLLEDQLDLKLISELLQAEQHAEEQVEEDRRRQKAEKEVPFRPPQICGTERC